MKTKHALLFSALSLAIFVGLACDVVEKLAPGLTDAEEAEVRLALSGMQQGSLEAALLAALTADLSLLDSGSAMAEACNTNAKAVFTPATCINAIVVDKSVNFTFEQCDGPYGIFGLDGAASLAFEDSAAPETNGVGASLTATTLSANSASLVLNITGVMRDQNGTRAWEFTSTGAGSSGGADLVTRSGSYGGKVAENCLQLDGAWVSTVNEDATLSTFSAFKRCEQACPSGGTVALASAEGTEVQERVLTLTFSGTNRVAWVSTDGLFGTLELLCE
ncbi:MAG: hypothetical protein RBU37_12495 [Myxococcota bacterium]|jgi:hypothetical protein|nr:hypothetical protein [Myxococcota bacterium]